MGPLIALLYLGADPRALRVGQSRRWPQMIAAARTLFTAGGLVQAVSTQHRAGLRGRSAGAG